MNTSRSHIYFLLAIIITLLKIVSAQEVENGPIVTLKDGKVRGRTALLFNGAKYYSFQGIPYAAPPLNELRFKPPMPPIQWEGVHDATKFGSVCVHVNITLHGDEDCLFVNVYTKSLRKSAKLPVMFYIFGGGYAYGSGNYFLPDYLLQHNVIVVTLNYRLEVLGFLSMDTPEAPGNAGLKDQVAALRWVKHNIVHFGGDPKRVTIIGDSAAGGSVTYHMLSPMSRGLFHQVIAQGGSCYNDWALATRTIARAFRIAKVLELEAKNIKELHEELMGLDQFQLTNLTFATLTYDETYRGPPPQFVPAVEKRFPNVDAFLTENPVTMLEAGKIVRVPLLIGYNNGEGLFYLNKYLSNLDFYNRNPFFWIGKQVALKVSSERLQELGEKIHNYYAGNKTLTQDDIQIIIDMNGDSIYVYNMHRFINAYARLPETKIYMYKFNLDTELNMVKKNYGVGHLKGVCHGDELWYIFKNYMNEHLYEQSLKIREMIYKVTKLWTDFVKTGNPTPDDSNEETWEPYTGALKEYYNIDHEFSLKYYADKERILFWDRIYEEAGLPHMT